jgi:hypothetical protein
VDGTHDENPATGHRIPKLLNTDRPVLDGVPEQRMTRPTRRSGGWSRRENTSRASTAHGRASANATAGRQKTRNRHGRDAWRIRVQHRTRICASAYHSRCICSRSRWIRPRGSLARLRQGDGGRLLRPGRACALERGCSRLKDFSPRGGGPRTSLHRSTLALRPHHRRRVQGDERAVVRDPPQREHRRLVRCFGSLHRRSVPGREG